MHRQVRRAFDARLRVNRRRDEKGAVALLMAVMLTSLAVASAMVLDFGLVRVDREIDRSVADDATLAGLHGLVSRADGSEHAYIGVCTAIRYLKSNNLRFAGLNEGSGWKNGAGATTASGCSNGTLRNKTCSKTDTTTWAKWTGTTSYGGASLTVTIQSAFKFAGSTAYPEDSLAASSGDTSAGGCDTLAVTIAQSRKPGIGSLATSKNLSTSLRSVGRVKTVPGSSVPALLLLKRSGCPSLRAGNSGVGSGTYIHVLGAVGSNGISSPGTIHADNDGTGCTGGSNSNIYIGAQNDAIVAYAAPLISNPTSPDPAKPGYVSSVATANGAATNVVRDNLNYVYGSSALNSGGTKNEVAGRTIVTRTLADDRYFTGVKAAITGSAAIFGASTPASVGFNKTLNNCTPTQADVSGINSTDKLWITCNANSGFNPGNLTINAQAVYFSGTVNPTGTLSMPNATKVYVANSGNKTNAININASSTSFEMNSAAANLTGGLCDASVSATKSIGTLFIKTGNIMEANGATLRLCRTTAFMLGGQANGCVPATSGTAPTNTPCSGTLGTGQINQTGGNIDWTAPNTLDATLDPTTFAPLPGATTAWANANGPEDLALWDESAASTSMKYTMTGGGTFNVRGVFMVPNADPFTMSGGAAMDLTNAQYIVSSIELNGGTRITMKVDPNSAIVLPDLGLVGLVR